jgi:uncharacterized membrane protein
MEHNTDENKWRLDKHIPLSLLVAMAVQTIFFASWLSSNMSEVRSELRNVSLRIEEIWRERYTQADARRDQEMLRLKDDDHARRLEDMERRMRAMESGRR